MQIGNVYNFDGQLFVVLDFDSFGDVYKVTFRLLFSGETRTEMVDQKTLETYQFVQLNFKKETKYHYKFDCNGIEYEFLKENIMDIIDYLKTSIWPNKRCKPVFIDLYEDNIKMGSNIHLFSKDADNIYYSLDDSEFQLYQNEITILQNSVLRSYGTKNGYDQSEITAFHFRIKNRTIKLYFSPSRQLNNKGILPERYSNEMEMMNLLSTKIQTYLKKKDVICYQNNPELLIKDWLQDGKEKNIDFHFALHSNATSLHNKKGPEIWIHQPLSKTYSLATLIYDNLYSIYDDNKNPMTNRGVKYAHGKIMECNDNYVDYGILLETAYHDNIEDINWMVSNLEEIAKNIANSLIQYFQL